MEQIKYRMEFVLGCIIIVLVAIIIILNSVNIYPKYVRYYYDGIFNIIQCKLNYNKYSKILKYEINGEKKKTRIISDFVFIRVPNFVKKGQIKIYMIDETPVNGMLTFDITSPQLTGVNYVKEGDYINWDPLPQNISICYIRGGEEPMKLPYHHNKIYMKGKKDIELWTTNFISDSEKVIYNVDQLPLSKDYNPNDFRIEFISQFEKDNHLVLCCKIISTKLTNLNMTSINGICFCDGKKYLFEDKVLDNKFFIDMPFTLDFVNFATMIGDSLVFSVYKPSPPKKPTDIEPKQNRIIINESGNNMDITYVCDINHCGPSIPLVCVKMGSDTYLA